MYAYHRWEGNQHIFALANLNQAGLSAYVRVPVERLNLDSTRTYYLSDLFSGDVYPATRDQLSAYLVTLEQAQVRVAEAAARRRVRLGGRDADGVGIEVEGSPLNSKDRTA